MRRSRLLRFIGLPLALWFVALATDVGGVDGCMMHGGAGHAGMVASDMPGQSTMPAGPTAPAPMSPMPCRCMGLCCGCAIGTLPPAPVVTVAVSAVPASAPRVERAQRGHVVAPAHLFPPANGPPVIHRV